MSRVRYGILALLVLLCVVCGIESVCAQGGMRAMDAQKCAQLQKQIDEVVAISESRGLSEQEKLNRLGAVVTQSLSGMAAAVKDFPAAAPILQEWNEMLTKLLATAGASNATDNRDISPDAQTGVDIAKNRIKPYIDVMKTMCPALVIPEKIYR